MKSTNVAIIGGGFAGLSAAYDLVRNGVKVVVVEAEPDVAGLAASFDVGGEKLDCFYHHWFTNDLEVMGLIEELGLSSHIEINPTNTGMYYANNFFRLSTPLDLLNFTPLPLLDRIRLGLLALRARRVKHWRELESLTASEWLKSLGGQKVYEVVWEPLLKGKFGPYADQISAVWFWNKLKLRGGSRGKGGEERLAYYRGGFASLAESLADRIRSLGGEIITSNPVKSFEQVGDKWLLETKSGPLQADKVLATVALPLVADMVSVWASSDYISTLQRIQYIGNVCLVLELEQKLSDTYWLNVNDPSFPFVGVIEHTNFERAETYGGSHIVYLSKYLPHTDALYSMDKDQFLDYALPYMQKMFPALKRSWIKKHYLWRARWSQPVVEKFYSQMIPPSQGPKAGFYLCSMAQIYPEDRGTNYAIREGRKVAAEILKG